MSAASTLAEEQDREEEIVANLAGGRVIVHVAKDTIIFAASDQPIEPHAIPPRVVGVDSGHIGVLFGASEWRLPADPKPIRLDRNFQRVSGIQPRDQYAPGEAEPDLELIGTAFLEKLRPLVAQLQLSNEREEDVRLLFKNANKDPKILIVTNKLLTGYDAPVGCVVRDGRIAGCSG